MSKILIIEDETRIARFLELELSHEGFEVESASDGMSGYEKAKTGKYDLILLDLMLPHISGTEVCRRLRSEKITTPIIMLTAKDDVSDKVAGLDVGADDYVTKPFFIEELFARIRNALRHQSTQDVQQHSVLECRGLKLDRDKFEVSYKGEPINLTKKEFELLEYLMSNKNIVLSREKIVEKVWGYEYVAETNVTDVYIRYLRSKIDERFGTSFIKTVRSVGYQFKGEE